MPFKSSSWMTKQFFNISITIFRRLTRSTEKDFFTEIWTLKTVPSEKKSNCRTCAEGCQMHINLLIPIYSPVWREAPRAGSEQEHSTTAPVSWARTQTPRFRVHWPCGHFVLIQAEPRITNWDDYNKARQHTIFWFIWMPWF